ncbi:MAG: hypothetical protein AAF485_17645 [Chloroflexota bacterium]
MAKKRYPRRPPVPIGELHLETCRHCGGNGQEPGLTDLTCRECAGRGQQRRRIVECSECEGKGKRYLGFLTCHDCQGKGWQAKDGA